MNRVPFFLLLSLKSSGTSPVNSSPMHSILTSNPFFLGSLLLQKPLRNPTVSCEYPLLPLLLLKITATPQSLLHTTLKTDRKCSRNLTWLTLETRSATLLLSFPSELCCEYLGDLSQKPIADTRRWRNFVNMLR